MLNCLKWLLLTCTVLGHSLPCAIGLFFPRKIARGTHYSTRVFLGLKNSTASFFGLNFRKIARSPIFWAKMGQTNYASVVGIKMAIWLASAIEVQVRPPTIVTDQFSDEGGRQNHPGDPTCLLEFALTSAIEGRNQQDAHFKQWCGTAEDTLLSMKAIEPRDNQHRSMESVTVTICYCYWRMLL